MRVESFLVETTSRTGNQLPLRLPREETGRSLRRPGIGMLIFPGRQRPAQLLF